MKYLKQWKWQLVVAAPFLPWLYIWHMNVTYDYAVSLGWHSEGSGMAVVLLTVAATVIFGIGYAQIYDDS